MRFLVALFLVGSAVIGKAQSFASDKRLDAPISMRVKIEPLSEFAADLTKLTKVHFSCATAISDRKITAIFKDRPAKEVLQAVRDAMFMDWKKDGSGYILIMPSEAQRDEEAAIKADQEVIRSGIVSALKALNEANGMSSADKQKKVADLASQIKTLRSSAEPDAAGRLDDLVEQRAIYASTAAQAFASDYAADFERDADSLLAGQTLCASTRSTDACPVLPPNFLDDMNSRSRSGSVATAALVIMHVDGAEKLLRGEAILSADEGARRGNSMMFILNVRPKLAGSAADNSKLAKRVLGWSAAADSSVMSKAIEPPSEAVPPGQFTLADNLEYLSDHAGIPVIGDAFRVYCSPSALTGEKTVGSYLAALTKPGANEPPRVSYYTSQHGWLYVRHNRYWNRLAVEVPESALRPMEKSVKDNGIPSIAEYAKFAAGLSDAQAGPLMYNSFSLDIHFDMFAFQTSICSLRLLATFSDQQVATLEQGSLRLATLTAEQRRVLTDCLAASMWRGSLPAELWRAVLSPQGMNYDGMEFKCRVDDYPQSEGVTPLPRHLVNQEQATFTYSLQGGQSFTEMYVVRKNFQRPGPPGR